MIAALIAIVLLFAPTPPVTTTDTPYPAPSVTATTYPPSSTGTVPTTSPPTTTSTVPTPTDDDTGFWALVAWIVGGAVLLIGAGLALAFRNRPPRPPS